MPIARKHSRKRDAILECLRCTTSHPTAEWVYTQLKPTIPDLSLATVYRNLAMFKDEGMIDSVGVYNGLERFDFRTDPHAHFICRICGAVSDINWLELRHVHARTQHRQKIHLARSSDALPPVFGEKARDNKAVYEVILHGKCVSWVTWVRQKF